MMEPKPLKLHDLKVYKEYRRLVLPLKDEERMRMETDIAHSAAQKPISIWCGRILVDYERYTLFHHLQLPFAITNISAKSGEETIDWICRNQLQRMDLTKEMRKYLIGRRCLARKIIDSHYAMSQPASRVLRSGEPKYETSLVRIRERLGAEYHAVYRLYGGHRHHTPQCANACRKFADRQSHTVSWCRAGVSQSLPSRASNSGCTFKGGKHG